MNIDAIVSLVSIYLFIGFGFLIKSRFKEKIDNKTLTLISVYILQPILTFWGLTLRPLDSSLLFAPFIHLIAIGTTLFLLLLFGSWVYKSDKKKEAIFVSMSLIGNTGNLGIPIGIAIFGVESVPYTSIINIANLFFVYTVGVYFLAKTEYSLKDSLKSVLAIPTIWVAMFAIGFSFLEIQIPETIQNSLEMGAHASIVIQLMIFGLFIKDIKFSEIDWKLNIYVSSSKLLLLPLVGLIVISYFNYFNWIGAVIILELMVPLAVNNVNMAALYNTYPEKVASIIVISSLLFIPIFILFLGYVFDSFGN